MEKKVYIFGALILIIAVVAGISLFVKNPGQLIGGQRDEHGCLGPAGYSWDENIGACTRSWEITGETQTQAAQTAAVYLDSKGTDMHGMTVISVETGDCDTCFTVHFTTADYKNIDVHLKDWTATD